MACKETDGWMTGRDRALAAGAEQEPPECLHGHKQRVVGCGSCVAVFDFRSAEPSALETCACGHAGGRHANIACDYKYCGCINFEPAPLPEGGCPHLRVNAEFERVGGCVTEIGDRCVDCGALVPLPKAAPRPDTHAEPTPEQGEREHLHSLIQRLWSLIDPEANPQLDADVQAVLTPCDDAGRCVAAEPSAPETCEWKQAPYVNNSPPTPFPHWFWRTGCGRTTELYGPSMAYCCYCSKSLREVPFNGE